MHLGPIEERSRVCCSRWLPNERNICELACCAGETVTITLQRYIPTGEAAVYCADKEKGNTSLAYAMQDVCEAVIEGNV
jgi:hypothetical protein